MSHVFVVSVLIFIQHADYWHTDKIEIIGQCDGCRFVPCINL